MRLVENRPGMPAWGRVYRPTRAPLRYHCLLPGYTPTPMVAAPRIAARVGAAEVLVKIESERFGLPSYKGLGVSWALFRAVCARYQLPTEYLDFAGVRREFARLPMLTVVAATDGNHGRAVAHFAAAFGWRSHIYVPRGMSPARITAIRQEGAAVQVVDGTYDETVAISARHGGGDTLIVSDTAWPGYDQIPAWVIEGYSTLFWEIEDFLSATGTAGPSVVVIPIGVGSLAAAAAAHYQKSIGGRPALVGVEPDTAACLFESARFGHPVEVPGPHISVMVGLNCGRPSPITWPLVQTSFNAFLAIDDRAVAGAMRLYAREGITAGETGSAGLAALLAVAGAGQAEQQHMRASTGLLRNARVLLIVTEGATDPDAYHAMIAGRIEPVHGSGSPATPVGRLE